MPNVGRSATMINIAQIEEDESENESSYSNNYIKFNMRIEDSGVGISKENLKNLFLNFGKLEEHDSMNQVGTGLGLSICKQLIE
jgi:signal transduction histidine kinase